MAIDSLMIIFQRGLAIPAWIRWMRVSMESLVRVMPVANIVSATRIIFRPRTAWVNGMSHWFTSLVH